MTRRIGITGGIGSGKTTVCKIFEQFGIPVYYADDRAKSLMTDNIVVKNQLIQAFGQEVYFENGQLNRAYLANIVFNEQAALDQLNAIAHPAVKQDGLIWDEQHKQTAYTLREAALIYEAGIDKQLDYVILVTAPEAMRIQRVMQRDNTTADAVRARMNKQWPQERKEALADFIIQNDGKHSLIQQVHQLHQRFNKH